MLSNFIKGSINAVYGYTEETISILVGVISGTYGYSRIAYQRRWSNILFFNP